MCLENHSATHRVVTGNTLSLTAQLLQVPSQAQNLTPPVPEFSVAHDEKVFSPVVFGFTGFGFGAA